MPEVATSERMAFIRSVRRLEYFTIGWNLAEGLVAVFAGVSAHSISLVGFGIDSFIEVASGWALLWRMSVDANVLDREWNEKRRCELLASVFCCLPFISLSNLAVTSGTGAHRSTAFLESFWPAFLS